MRRAARVNMPLGRPLKLQQLKLKFALDTGCCCYSRQSGLTVAMAAAKSSRKRQQDSAGEWQKETGRVGVGEREKQDSRIAVRFSCGIQMSF